MNDKVLAILAILAKIVAMAVLAIMVTEITQSHENDTYSLDFFSGASNNCCGGVRELGAIGFFRPLFRARAPLP